ncbi:MAG TPA: hypothetical protein DEP35_20240 [Deltaproteobacteria bacterium]|nr:hypothetical protein [Deltaproteobacteria bacterium]
MKVAANGGLNLSVMDGWWCEAYDSDRGWAIASSPFDAERQDDLDAAALADLLANEVIPLFYERSADGIPVRWIAWVRKSMRHLIPRFSADRMLRDYADMLYAKI